MTRSIGGHLTERMQHHYSTVNAAEQPDEGASSTGCFYGLFFEREKGFEPSTSTLARRKRAFLAVTACDKY